MYIGDITGRRKVYSPDTLAIVDAGKTPHWRFTYAQMDDRANRLANWLRRTVGVRKGDRVGILARDGVEYLDLYFACGKTGAIMTCFNWRLHPRELLQLMQDTTPRALVFSEDFADTVAEVMPEAPFVSHLLHIEGDSMCDSRHFEDALAMSTAEPVVDETVTEEDIICLLFTGGTTGLPKAAQISHRQVAWNAMNTVIHDIRHGDVTVNVFPLFHAGGLFAYTMPMMILGGTVILTRQFDPAQVLDLIQQYRATFFGGVPTMYQMLTTAPTWDSADLSSLRFCTSGGAPLPVALVEKFRDEKHVQFKQGFGMTEFGPGLFALAPEDAIHKAGSIGRPNFFVDARIVDENNQPLGPGEVGELVLKGPSRASGYFNNPEASAAVMDADGWFHTGDMAKHDDQWYFYIVDRKKDMFISGGENIYPTEIEQVLYRHPAVHMCAVIGVPDARWGEVGKACVVLKPGHSVTEAELIEHMQTNLARFKVPRSVMFMETLPISAAGKILKRELRQQFTDKS